MNAKKSISLKTDEMSIRSADRIILRSIKAVKTLKLDLKTFEMNQTIWVRISFTKAKVYHWFSIGLCSTVSL